MSKLEDELVVQLKAAGMRLKPEFVFCPGRKWAADFVVRPPAGKDPNEVGEIQGFPTLGGRPLCLMVLVDVQGIGPQGRHGGWDHIESDCEKFSTAAALGWRVLPVTGKMVRSGLALALIEAALGLRPLQVARRAQPKRRGNPPSHPAIPRRRMAAAGKADPLAALPERVRKAALAGKRPTV